MLREGFEAALIVAILYAYLHVYVAYVGIVTWLFLRTPKQTVPAAPGKVPEKLANG